MSKAKIMSAGTVGTSKRIRVNGPEGGGDALQGLPPICNMRSALVPYVRTRTDGDNRNVVFCVNQLSGGVGAKRGQFGPGNRAGVGQTGGCRSGKLNWTGGYLPRTFNEFLNLADKDGNGTVTTVEAKNAGLEEVADFDTNNDGIIDYNEFHSGMTTLYRIYNIPPPGPFEFYITPVSVIESGQGIPGLGGEAVGWRRSGAQYNPDDYYVIPEIFKGTASVRFNYESYDDRTPRYPEFVSLADGKKRSILGIATKEYEDTKELIVYLNKYQSVQYSTSLFSVIDIYEMVAGAPQLIISARMEFQALNASRVSYVDQFGVICNGSTLYSGCGGCGGGGYFYKWQSTLDTPLGCLCYRDVFSADGSQPCFPATAKTYPSWDYWVKGMEDGKTYKVVITL